MRKKRAAKVRRLRRPYAERFWARVDRRGPDECWLFRRKHSRSEDYYKTRFDDGTDEYVHRIAYTLSKGPIPHGLVVRHSCDVPRCCNPDHLLIGTLLDNNQDKVDRNRQARGEGAGTVKLTAQQVVEIRQLVELGNSRRRLALRFGVATQTIDDLVTRRTWKHVS